MDPPNIDSGRSLGLINLEVFEEGGEPRCEVGVEALAGPLGRSGCGDGGWGG